MSDSILRLRALPLSARVLFTAFLAMMGIGYLMAVFYLFLVEVNPQRKMGMSTVEGVIHKFYGQRNTTKLEAALRSTMSEYISPTDREKISGWVRGGPTKENFVKIQPIFANNCMACHGPEVGQKPILTNYEEVAELVKVDLGESVRRLAQVSHVHLFGMSFIFLLTGAIFSLCDLRESVKVIVVFAPFAAMLLDIGSWWLTHYQAVFAYTVLAGGALMSLVVPIQVCVPIYQMWCKKRQAPR